MSNEGTSTYFDTLRLRSGFDIQFSKLDRSRTVSYMLRLLKYKMVAERSRSNLFDELNLIKLIIITNTVNQDINFLNGFFSFLFGFGDNFRSVMRTGDLDIVIVDQGF